MFSDNENPGVEVSAGQTATAATPAPEPTTPTEQTEPSIPAAAETVHVPEQAAGEPAAVTVAPAEPVAAPDGAAAVEHSDVSTAVEVDGDEPSTESTSEMEQLMEQYAVPQRRRGRRN